MDIFDLPKQFISRKREVEAISYGFTKSNTVLLIGIAGIGKSIMQKLANKITGRLLLLEGMNLISINLFTNFSISSLNKNLNDFLLLMVLMK